jgi:hypothetical protein
LAAAQAALDLEKKVNAVRFFSFTCLLKGLSCYLFIILRNSFKLAGSSGKRSLDRISVDRNCVLSLDQNYVNHLIEYFDTFHLIELFDQLIKKN